MIHTELHSALGGQGLSEVDLCLNHIGEMLLVLSGDGSSGKVQDEQKEEFGSNLGTQWGHKSLPRYLDFLNPLEFINCEFSCSIYSRIILSKRRCLAPV